jgi:hypothetical protein
MDTFHNANQSFQAWLARQRLIDSGSDQKPIYTVNRSGKADWLASLQARHTVRIAFNSQTIAQRSKLFVVITAATYWSRKVQRYHHIHQLR